MASKEILQKARDLLSDEKRWTRGFFARAANGNSIGPEEEPAVCWCLLGALRKISSTSDEAYTVQQIIEVALGFDDIAEFNDDPETSHADVLALLDKAIAL